MERILHLEQRSGKRQNGYTQKEKEMGTVLLVAKGFLWTTGNWILIAMGMATATQLALWLGILSTAVQFGYTSYKWLREGIKDWKEHKNGKPNPFKKRKKL